MKTAKKRYILAMVESASPLSREGVQAAVDEAVLEAFGQNGLAESGARVKEFNPETRLALVKVSLGFQEKAIAAFALKRSFNSVPFSLSTQKIFGTLRKARPLFPGARPASRRRRVQKQ